MELTKIWEELKTTGSYTPAWEPCKDGYSFEDCYNICKALAEKEKAVTFRKTRTVYFFKEGLEFSIYATYDFENYNSSEEPGFKDSLHYVIKINKFKNIEW